MKKGQKSKNKEDDELASAEEKLKKIIKTKKAEKEALKKIMDSLEKKQQSKK